MRLVTFNIASLDGRIAVSRSTPSWLDSRWKPPERFEPADVMALHQARLTAQGSNSFTARSAGPTDFGDFPGRPVPAGDSFPRACEATEASGCWWLTAGPARGGAPSR